MQKKKKATAEDFVGWKSDDGLLEVVGIHGKQGRITTFKVICHKCKEDKELFPDGYFVSLKGSLVKGSKPCGCAFNPKWNKEQYLILARRVSNDRFIVHGFSEEFHGQKTKLSLECLKDGHKWNARVDSVINSKRGCPKCADRPELTEEDALEKCEAVCKKEGYQSLGFIYGYKDSRSVFSYTCPSHGKHIVRYCNFIHGNNRCPVCSGKVRVTEKEAFDKCKEICEKEGYKPLGFTDKYKNTESYFLFICTEHGEQQVKVCNFLSGNRCKYCSIEASREKYRTLNESKAINRCKEICHSEGYYYLEFPEGYKNNQSRFEYICPKHGVQNVSCNNFVRGRRCKWCAKEKQREISSGFYGYYPERKDEVDYLYVLNFNDKFIKVGRSFDVDERIRSLGKPSESGIKNIHKLRIFTATHQEIYDLEQDLHSELRERNFQHYVDWSTECFTSDSLPFLNMLLDKCGLEEVNL